MILVYTSIVEDGCGGQLLRNLAAVRMDERKGVGSDHSSLYVVKCIFFFLVNEGLWFFFVCLGNFFYSLCCFKGNSIHGQTKRGSPHQLDPFVRIMNTLPKSERLEPNHSGGNDFLQVACGQVAVKDCTCHSSGFRLCILGAKNPTHNRNLCDTI